MIFLTTKQWFITVSNLKDKMADEIQKTAWHPGFAGERFREFVSTAPDWCISRQRYWGIPLPIWKCESCKDTTVIGSKDELPKVKELHRPYIDEVKLDCECGGKMSRIPDVLDVWFDSGNAIWASLSKEESEKYGETADVIIEGQDQIRGWFYSLLGSGIVRYEHSPYKRLLMHGFFVDEHGEKMSKSLGNFIPLEEIMEKYGADTFRLWSLSNTVWDELKFSWEELKTARSDINILYNLVTFLERFYPKKKIDGALELEEEDKWLISRLNSTIRNYRTAFSNYEVNKAVKSIRGFISNDLSRFYMKIAKDRISKGNRADEALYTIYIALEKSIVLLNPVAPFVSEYLYQKYFKQFEKIESVSLMGLPVDDEGKIDAISEKRMAIIQDIISKGLLARQQTGIKTRWPVRTIHIETKSHEVIDAVANFAGVITKLMNAKEVKTSEERPSGDVSSSEFEGGKVHISKRIDEEMYEEGILNEVKRRIQNLRKIAGLVEKDKIKVSMDTEKEIEAIVKKNQDQLQNMVNASEVTFKAAKEMDESVIDGRQVKIKIEKSK